MPQPVYDPRGVVTAEARPMAPRRRELGGLRLAVLDNTKWNANKLLRTMSERLAPQAGFAQVNYYRKESFSKVAAPALLAEIARDNDLVLTAIGDWGSCTSCCMHDGVELEALGRPTAVVVTTAFTREAEVQRQALGMPGLAPVVIEHPLSTLSAGEIDARAEAATTQALAIWRGV